MPIYSYTLSLILIFSLSSLAQNNTCHISISGYVLDEHDRSPLALTQIYILENKRGAVADSSGFYTISGLCPGKYTIVASHIGCEPVVRKITVADNLSLNFFPEHHRELLLQAEIVANRVQEISEVKIALSEEDLEASRGKNLAEAIEQIAGVRTLKTGNTVAKPLIHGLHGNRILTLNNGIRQEDQQWGLEHAPNIDPFTAGDIAVVKGVGAVQYDSGAMGGVVILKPSPLPFGQKLGGNVYLIGQTNGRGGLASATLEQGFGQNWAARLQMSGKKMGDLSSPGYILSNTAAEELNGSLEIGYKGKKLNADIYYSHFSGNMGILSASHIGNLTDLENAINRSKPLIVEPFTYKIKNPRQEVNHELLKSEIQFRIRPQHLFTATYGLQLNQRKEYDVRKGKFNNIPANSLHLTTHSLDMVLQSQHNIKLEGKYGLSGTIQENSNIAGTGIRPILPNYNKYQTGIFILEKWHHKNWIMEAGLRYDYQHLLVQKYDLSNQLLIEQFNFNNYSASLGATHIFGDHLIYSSFLGYTHRSPHPIELFSEGLHHGSAIIEEGNMDLQPEKSINWSNTLSINYAGKFRAKFTAYVNSINDYIFLDPQTDFRLTVRGAFPVYHYTQTDALLSGLDLDGEYFFLPKWKYIFGGSLIRGTDRTNDDDLVLMPADQLTHGLRWMPDNFRNIKNAFFEIRHQMVRTQHLYPENPNSAIPPPPSGYHLLSSSVGMEFPLAKNNLSLSFSVENITNSAYRDYLNRQRFYADETGRNFILKFNYQF